METLVHREGLLPTLEDPLLLIGVEGPFGASGAAALAYLAERWEAVPLATVNPDTVFDLTVRRPVVVGTGQERRIEWPSLRLMHARPDGAARDVLLLVGPEPHLRWAALAEEFADVLEALGCRQAVRLTVIGGGVPHTRPTSFRLIDADPALSTLFAMPSEDARYQGPIDFGSSFATYLQGRGVSAATLLGVAPFYMNVDPLPHAVIDLVQTIDGVLGSQTDVTPLVEQRGALNQRAAHALARSDQLRTQLQQLEQHYDEAAKQQASLSTLSEDEARELADEVEHFLQMHQRDGGSTRNTPR